MRDKFNRFMQGRYGVDAFARFTMGVALVAIILSIFFRSGSRIGALLDTVGLLVYLLPGLLIFPGWYGLNGIWISMPVADGLAFITAIIILTVYTRKMKNILLRLQSSDSVSTEKRV